MPFVRPGDHECELSAQKGSLFQAALRHAVYAVRLDVIMDTRLLIHVENQGFLKVSKTKAGETLVASGDQDGQASYTVRRP